MRDWVTSRDLVRRLCEANEIQRLKGVFGKDHVRILASAHSLYSPKRYNEENKRKKLKQAVW